MEFDLNEIAIFVKVVETGSFTQAARQLMMPNSTVSAKVSSLEERLGLTLIRRTTRKLSITAEGQAFYLRCSQGLSEILNAQKEVTTAQAEPQGVLRVTAPIDLGGQLLPSVISSFLKKYPKVTLELMLEERRVDLVAEGVDLAIRVGELEDSSLIAKRLGSVYFAAMASPRYLKKMKPLIQPKDLIEHECIQFMPLGVDEWVLSSGRNSTKVAMNGKLLSNSLNIVKGLALDGHGIALLPTFFCAEEFHAGTLKRVLPQWVANSRPVQFVYPAQKYVSPKLAAFIDFTSEIFKEMLASYELK